MKTRVIFRKFKTTESIVAIFPELTYPKYTSKRGFVMDYMFIGQHGECDYNTIMKMTTIATPKEYNILKAILEDIGYDVEIVTQKKYEKSLTIKFVCVEFFSPIWIIK